MKVLIIRLSSLGDIVLTEPITRELRRIYPSAQIDYLCKSAFVGIAQAMPELNKVISYSKDLRFHLSLLKQNYDLVLDLHAKFSTMLCTLMLPSKRILRYRKHHILRRRIVKNHSKEKSFSTLDFYYDLLNCLDESASISKQNPRLLPQVSESLPSLPSSIKHVVAMFPGANHQTKMLPIKKIVELIGLCDDSYFFLIMGSDKEAWLGEIVSNQDPPNAMNLCGKYDLKQLISILSQVDLVISNDSGPMHIAAALQKAQIAIFGATHPSLGFAPLNPKAKIVALEPNCQPCSLHGSESCPLGHFRCMNEIESSHLASLVHELTKNQA